jgi:hypothetical protein
MNDRFSARRGTYAFVTPCAIHVRHVVTNRGHEQDMAINQAPRLGSCHVNIFRGQNPITTPGAGGDRSPRSPDHGRRGGNSVPGSRHQTAAASAARAEQSATSWRWVIPALARTHPVLALSLPGCGKSAPAPGGGHPAGHRRLAVLISRMPGGDLAHTTMSAVMLFAQPWRIPAEFIADQHALARRPASSRPPPRRPGPCSGRTGSARSCG